MISRFKTAAPRPPRIRREDYRPPDWLVPEVALEFDLGAELVRVRMRASVVRCGEHAMPLRLEGEGLKLVSLAVDGKPAAHRLDRAGLTVRIGVESAVVETLVEFAPGREQHGLFALDNLLCTQCEPHGFRRITFFPDRPDVLARFRTRIVADAARYPVLHSNGNPAGSGTLEGGRHWAEWHDPFPKPSYLFALVAGDLAARRDRFVTRSGSEVAVGIWGTPERLGCAEHAMASLKAAMAWDEAHYGREYDLVALNVVAVAGYAFGAVESKGLKIFDAPLLLADPATATDADLAAVTALIGHEYFHNWSGNRVTIRDWFQLPLKEGLTVFRDQQFCADQGSAAVKRIQDVRALRAAQFARDAGPDAHPVRPDSYEAIAELYTATVYAKGAELVRMLHTLLGPERFRAGADRYFERHDGQAATCEDLIAAMDPDGELGDFAAWYARAGTPVVRAALDHDEAAGRATLTLEQDGAVPVPIPLRTALFGSNGKLGERLLLLDSTYRKFEFQVSERPILSINRGFSAPVIVDAPRSIADLARLAICDDDPFARWDSMQELMLATLLAAIEGRVDHGPVIEAVGHALDDGRIEPGWIAEAAVLPAQASVAARLAVVDPGAIHAAWLSLRADLGRALGPAWRAAYEAAPVDDPGGRALRSVALDYLLAGGAADAAALALRQIEAPTPTERAGALRALADSDVPERVEGLAIFHRNCRGDQALLDRWFTAQALSLRADAIDVVPKLLAHPDFTLAHPTRLSALVGGFAANHHAFHDATGRGHRFLADVVLAADRLNPQASTSLASPLTHWRRLEPLRAASMRRQLERIAVTPGISDPLRDLTANALA